MRASRLGFWTGAALGLFTLFAACSSSTDVETGTGGSGNAAAGGHTQSGGGGGTGATGAGGGGSCTDGAEQCVGGVHEVCANGSFETDPCPGGQGCDDASGTCVACMCTPGLTGNCASATALEVCLPSCLALSEQACNPSETCAGGTCLAVVCTPGTAHCPDPDTSEICNASGTGYEPGATCGPKETCTETVGCETLCAAYARAPSSVGCSFFALNMDNFDEGHTDAVVVGNTSSTLTAVVSLWGAPGGVESLIQADVQIPPLGQHTFTLPNTPADYIESVSQLRPGGSFRVESDLPVIAYQHSPLTPYYTNDASCLLPEATLGRHYFVPSYYDALNGYPSYFNVIATENNTQVTITVPHPTAGGSGVSALAAGGSTTVTMNRYDTLQVVNGAGLTTAERDVMGAEIDATAPVAVFGAIECAQVPAGYTYCDHMEEQAVPVRNWGTTYVGAHVPRRSASERYYWRVMSQAPGTVVDTTPPQPGFPVTLDAGQFYEFYTQESFIFTGSSPFAAYQYITGQDAFGAGTGDPAMITAVPVEQFLNRYVLLTPSGYAVDYVQIIRTTGDDVLVDGVAVPANAYYTVGAYTVADYAVAAGPHVITSVSPFGIVGAGYTGATSYGYPGGMALNNIAPE
ncbi:MAG: IgGFc-binding protein [Polyangiaceae bacterium]|nr:IgGFc-binding protein [Polyangiaceae bacterium]